MERHSPKDVLPQAVAAALPSDPYWFVIGGQAVRCFCPYRPSRDVDFGVVDAKGLEQLHRHLRRRGHVELIEKAKNTLHLSFDGTDVSVFVLRKLLPFVEDGSLGVTGVLATKTHAVLDRGLRRDFFDVYVMLHLHALGLADCLRALRSVYAEDINDGLVLRALVFFDDAEAEPALPGEGPDDWRMVKDFFGTAVAALIMPPAKPLAIQKQQVDVRGGAASKKNRASATSRPKKRRH